MRNISFMLTTDQVRARTKTVTRRTGWAHAAEGQALCGVEKSQGLKPGEAMNRLCVIRLKDVRREPLNAMLDDGAYGEAECKAEGFPNLSPGQFVEFFCDTHHGVMPDTLIGRLAFDYLDVFVVTGLTGADGPVAWLSYLDSDGMLRVLDSRPAQAMAAAWPDLTRIPMANHAAILARPHAAFVPGVADPGDKPNHIIIGAK